MNSGYKIEGGLQTSYTSVTVNAAVLLPPLC